MSVISKWMCELTEWMETVSRGMVDTEQRTAKLETTISLQDKRLEELEGRADGLEGSSNELRYREMEILERVDMLETGGMFGKGMLARLTKLEDWKQGCEFDNRIDALEQRLPLATDPFGKYVDGYPPVGHPDRRDTQTPDIDSVDARKDDFQPKPSLAADLTEGVKQVQAVAANIPKPSQPELVKGFWYKDFNGKLVKWDGIFTQAQGSYMPWTLATLDDLAHEVEGVKVWMVDVPSELAVSILQSNCEHKSGHDGTYLDEYIARHIAEKCGWCIITEEQWELLTKEAAK